MKMLLIICAALLSIQSALCASEEAYRCNASRNTINGKIELNIDINVSTVNGIQLYNYFLSKKIYDYSYDLQEPIALIEAIDLASYNGWNSIFSNNTFKFSRKFAGSSSADILIFDKTSLKGTLVNSWYEEEDVVTYEVSCIKL